MSVSIAALDFWELIAKPSLQDFYIEPNSYRKMVVAIWAIDALVEHICWENYSDQMKSGKKDFLELKNSRAISTFQAVKIFFLKPGYKVLKSFINSRRIFKAKHRSLSILKSSYIEKDKKNREKS